MIRPILKFTLSLIISVSLLWYVLGHFQLDLVIRSIMAADYKLLMLSFFIMVLAYIFRAARWMIWIPELTFWKCFKTILVGFMGNNLLPARLGEILRAHCASGDTVFGRTATLASIAAERILDGFTLSVFCLVGLSLVNVAGVLYFPLLSIAVGFILLTLLLVASIIFHERMRKTVASIQLRFPGHITRIGYQKFSFFLDGLVSLRRFHRFGLAAIMSVVVWSLEFSTFILIAKAFESVRITVAALLLFLVTVNFASLFPFTVGGIGAIEGAASLLLISIGVPPNYALGMTLVQHAFQFGFTVVAGLIFFYSDRYYNLPIVRKSVKSGSDEDMTTREQFKPYSYAGNLVRELAAELDLESSKISCPDLSVVIPAYNEEARLSKTLLMSIKWLHEREFNYEVLVVDDGSKDQTVMICNLFQELIPSLRIITCPHKGKGAAVRIGMLNASGSKVLFMDADGATPLDEILTLTIEIENGFDVVIGSRVVQTPEETVVKTSFHRKLIGRIFAALVNVFAIKGIADTQCGFKMFRHDCIKPIFYSQKLEGFAFDVEILHIAQKLGYSIKEVPVNWFNQPGSKVNLIADSIKMLIDILRVKWIHAHLADRAAEIKNNNQPDLTRFPRL